MSIELSDNVLAIWYVKLDAAMDLMIALMRGEGGYHVKGRTRMYLGDPNDPWDDNDRKRWFGGSVKGPTDDEAVKQARENMVTLTTSFSQHFRPPDPPMLFELVRGQATVEEFAKRLQSMPWAHSMEATVH